LPITVDLAEPLGSETVLHGRLADGTELTARLAGGVPGPGLHLAPDLSALHVFDAAGGRRLDAA
jgi:sn-glycerol 3-phosphate transport system ATP-binding protein